MYSEQALVLKIAPPSSLRRHTGNTTPAPSRLGPSTVSEANTPTTEVLVVGAGPTGLTTALELARRGIAIRVVERNAERPPISKALVVQARTLELMDIAGLADAFVNRGYPAPGLNVSLGADKPASIDLRNLDTRFPYLLVLPQNETEEILESGLRQAGGSVERGVEFVRIEQRNGSGLLSKLRTADGQEAAIYSRYLVACDGAHSTIRHALDLSFEGKQYETIVFLADVNLDADLVKSRIANFTSSRGFVSVLPFLGDYSRPVGSARQSRVLPGYAKSSGSPGRCLSKLRCRS